MTGFNLVIGNLFWWNSGRQMLSIWQKIITWELCLRANIFTLAFTRVCNLSLGHANWLRWWLQFSATAKSYKVCIICSFHQNFLIIICYLRCLPLLVYKTLLVRNLEVWVVHVWGVCGIDTWGSVARLEVLSVLYHYLSEVQWWNRTMGAVTVVVHLGTCALLESWAWTTQNWTKVGRCSTSIGPSLSNWSYFLNLYVMALTCIRVLLALTRAWCAFQNTSHCLRVAHPACASLTPLDDFDFPSSATAVFTLIFLRLRWAFLLYRSCGWCFLILTEIVNLITSFHSTWELGWFNYPVQLIDTI